MREEFKIVLFEAAKLKADSMGFTFTSMTEDEIKDFISQGVNRMNVMELASISDKNRAVRNTEILIEKMAQDSRYRNSGYIDFKSFNNVRDIICPLWPFC